MRLLIDVDALCKLAHWGLLEEIPSLMGIPLQECTTLASSKYRAIKAKSKLDGRVFHAVEAADRVLEAIALMQAPMEPASQSLGDFENVLGIDAGEAVLLASLVAAPDTRLLTGDKRALGALAALPPEAREPFLGRVICVERIIEAGLNQWGLDVLRSKVCPWKKIDVAVNIIMGSRCDAGEASVREALASYIGELTSLCDPSLICEKL